MHKYKKEPPQQKKKTHTHTDCTPISECFGRSLISTVRKAKSLFFTLLSLLLTRTAIHNVSYIGEHRSKKALAGNNKKKKRETMEKKVGGGTGVCSGQRLCVHTRCVYVYLCELRYPFQCSFFFFLFLNNSIPAVDAHVRAPLTGITSVTLEKSSPNGN